jgi:hypothetical protein
MADELTGGCGGGDYIGEWVSGDFVNSILCPFADSALGGLGISVLLLAGIIIFISLSTDSFTITAVVAIITAGFLFQVITYGPIIRGLYLLTTFAFVGALYKLYAKFSDPPKK